MDVSRHEDDVLDALALDVPEQLLAFQRVAVPGVEAEIAAAEDPRRHDHHLVGHDLPRCLRRRELALDPVHLGTAEEVARLPKVGAGRTDGVAARLVGAVAALIHDDHVDRPAELEATVDPLARGGEVRHGLVEGPVRGRLALLREALDGRKAAVGACAAGVVVLHLVVVPEGDHGKLLVHLPEVRVGAVQLVLVAVVLERHRRPVDATGIAAGRDAADVVVAHAGPVRLGVVGLVVDVVAEVDDEVHVEAGQHLVRVVVAVREVLAGEEREGHRLLRVGGQGGAEAAHDGVLRLRREAVEVLLVGLEAGDLRLDRAVHRLARADTLGRHELLEVLVGGHLEGDGRLLVKVVQARPQRDPAGGRVARDDAVGEGAPADERGGLRGGQPRGESPRGDDDGEGAGSGGRDELAAGLHGGDSNGTNGGGGQGATYPLGLPPCINLTRAGAAMTIASRRSDCTASTNVVSTPLPNAAAATAKSPPGVVAR